MWLSVLDLDLAIELAVGAVGLVGVFVVGFVPTAALDLIGVVFGLRVRVAWFIRLLAAYGSAVAGRVNSGRRGRRTGAAIKDPEADMLGAWLEPDVFVARDEVVVERAMTEREDTGLEDVDAVEMVEPGESADMAEVGRSGTFAAAAAFRCAAITSRTDWRPLNAPGLALDAPLVALETEDAREPAFGLFESFSSNCLDFASRFSMILSMLARQ